MAPLVVGFDLDLTLIDSRPGIAATYRALSARTGVYVDADAAVTRLGPPLEVELSLWFPAPDVPAAASLYRQLYPAVAVRSSPILPGVAEALGAVRGRGGGVVVITGKYEANALLHLDHLGLAVDAVVGWAWAEAKTEAMMQLGVGVYVGDHPADMAAARAAGRAAGTGVYAVGVTTGTHGADELVGAGADAVLADLTEFCAWIDRTIDQTIDQTVEPTVEPTIEPISVGPVALDR